MATTTATQAPPGRYVRAAAPLHTIFLLVILAGWALLGWIMVHRMMTGGNPHRTRSYALTLGFEWLVFAYVLGGVRRHGASALVVIGTRWSSFRELLRDMGIAAAFWLAAAGTLQLVGGLLFAHTQRPNQDFLLPHRAGEFLVWIALSVSAGICEEAIFRGYLQHQFAAFTRSAPAGIILSAIAFGAGHAYQGARMTILIAVYGLMFGLLAHWRSSVRPGMIAHAWQDSLSGLAGLLKLR
jgi:membrane protease YdiL (CAAX protease family)